MVLFPELFGNNSAKFERASTYLITNYNAVCHNLRDAFTSGGRKIIDVKGGAENISKIRYKLFSLAKGIESALNKIDKESLEYYWGVEIEETSLKTWKSLLKKHAKDPAIVNIFNEGLKNG